MFREDGMCRGRGDLRVMQVCASQALGNQPSPSAPEAQLQPMTRLSVKATPRGQTWAPLCSRL